jgi:ATP-dependent exoDNAse (exonuclease V) alpha subunit
VLCQPIVVERIKGFIRLIIDEASMLSRRLLNFVKRILQQVRKDISSDSYGGVQVILLGDFTQLPPVEKRHARMSDKEFAELVGNSWCFSGDSWQALNLKPFLLTKVERTNEPVLRRLVANASSNSWTPEDTQEIQRRKFSTETLRGSDKNNNITFLSAARANADRINSQIAADKIKTKKDPSTHIYQFSPSEEFSRKVSDDLKKQLREGCRFPHFVSAFPGCRVMFLAPGKVQAYHPTYKKVEEVDIVNGTIADVFDYGEKEFFEKQDKLGILGSFGRDQIRKALKVKLKSGYTFLVGGMEDSVTIGDATLTRFQYPVDLCYAITIHKSQSKSFDRIHIVMTGSESFTTGLFYVALSRARTLTGITIDQAFDMSKVRLGPHDDVKRLYAKLFPDVAFPWSLGCKRSLTLVE